MHERWRSLIGVNALILTALAVGLVNNILIAAMFGLTRRVDAFFAARMLPTLFMVLCIDYLGKNFLPVFAQAKQEGEASAARMTSVIVTVVLLLAAAAAAVLVTFSEPLFGVLLPGFKSSGTALVARYFWIMSPSIVLMAVNTFHEYVCQYNDKFVQVAAIRLSLPVANLAAIVLLRPFVGEYCLPWGYLAGNVASFVLLARAAGYRFQPSLAIRPHLEKKVFTNSAVVMSTGLVARTRSIIMNYLASSLGSGAISALAFAAKLTEPLERGAFSGARMLMFSHTAHLLVEKNERELGTLYGMGLRASFLLLAPVLWWIGLNSHTIVAAFFARGHFTAQMTTLVSVTLIGLAPSILFLGLNQLLSNAFYAMDRIAVPAVLMPAGTLVYVACAVLLAPLLGTEGIALATTLTSIAIFGVLFLRLSRVLETLKLARTSIRLAGYAVLSGGAMLAVTATLTMLHLPASVIACVGLPAGAAVYAGGLAFVRDRTSLALLRFARAWYSRRRVPA